MYVLTLNKAPELWRSLKEVLEFCQCGVLVSTISFVKQVI